MPRIAEHPDLDPDLCFESQVLTDLYQYWQTARADNVMPCRADISPLDMPPELLPHILLVDVEYQPKTRFRWRLIGTHITMNLQRDSTAAYWDDIYDSDELNSLELRTSWVLQNRAPIRSIGRITPIKQRYGFVETFLAPLSDDRESINLILMGADYNLSQ